MGLFTKTKGDPSHLRPRWSQNWPTSFCNDYADKMYKELGLEGERKVLNKVVCHVLRSWDPTVALPGWLGGGGGGGWWHNHQWKCEKMLQISDHLDFTHRVMSPVRIAKDIFQRQIEKMLQISDNCVMSLVRIIFSKRQWGWQQWWEELPVHRVQGSTWHYIGRSPEQVKYDLIQSYIICGDQFGMFMIFIMDKCQGDDGFYLIKIDHDFRNMMRYPIWLSEAEGFINRLQCCSVRCKPGKYV